MWFLAADCNCAAEHFVQLADLLSLIKCTSDSKNLNYILIHPNLRKKIQKANVNLVLCLQKTAGAWILPPLP